MQEHHFFPDTCFLIDYPDFHWRFLFGDGPCTIVICDPVLDQLDRRKKESSNLPDASQAWTDHRDDAERAFRAREAIRTINGIWEKRIELPENLCLAHYRGRARRIRNVDREILHLAKRYARQNKNARTILLTPDNNFRSMAYGSTVQAVNPAEWHNARYYERLLCIGVVLDDSVRMAHETHISLKAQLNEAGIAQDNGKLEQIQEQLAAAKEKLHAEVQRFETERKRLTEKILQAWQQDSAVRETHQRRTLLEDKVYTLAASGPSSELTDILIQLKEAHQAELAELERYENEERNRREAEREAREKRRVEEQARRKTERKEHERRVAQMRAQQEAARKEQEKREAELRKAQRNKYQVELPDVVQSPSGELTYPIETPNFEAVGQILVSRYWWYIEQQRNDLVCTLHIHAKIGEELAPELLVVSASDKLEYKPPYPYKLISPSNRGSAPITVGSWKIVVWVEELETDWKPLLRSPRFRYGTSPAFASLKLNIAASEMDPAEIQLAEHARHLAEQQAEETAKELSAPRENKQKPWWLLALVIPIAFFILLLLVPIFLCLLSIMLDVFLAVLSR